MRVPNDVNDKKCVNCVTVQEDSVYVSSKVNNLNPPPVLAGKKVFSVTSKRETVNLHVNSCAVSPVRFAKEYLQKKGVNPVNCHFTEIKFKLLNSQLCLHTLLYFNEAPTESNCLVTYVGGLLQPSPNV